MISIRPLDDSADPLVSVLEPAETLLNKRALLMLVSVHVSASIAIHTVATSEVFAQFDIHTNLHTRQHYRKLDSNGRALWQDVDPLICDQIVSPILFEIPLSDQR